MPPGLPHEDEHLLDSTAKTTAKKRTKAKKAKKPAKKKKQ